MAKRLWKVRQEARQRLRRKTTRLWLTGPDRQIRGNKALFLLCIFTDVEGNHEEQEAQRGTQIKRWRQRDKKDRKTEIQSEVESEATGSGASETRSSTTDGLWQAGLKAALSTERDGVTRGDFRSIKPCSDSPKEELVVLIIQLQWGCLSMTCRLQSRFVVPYREPSCCQSNKDTDMHLRPA